MTVHCAVTGDKRQITNDQTAEILSCFFVFGVDAGITDVGSQLTAGNKRDRSGSPGNRSWQVEDDFTYG